MLIISFLLVLILILLIINIYFVFIIYKNRQLNDLAEIKNLSSEVLQHIRDKDIALKEDFSINRKEFGQNSKELREEISSRVDLLSQNLSSNLSDLMTTIEKRFTSYQDSTENNAQNSRNELQKNLKDFGQGLSNAFRDFKETLRNNFSDFNSQQQTQNIANTEKLNEVKRTLETSIKDLSEGNEKKLEEMRKTVDEKLQQTLETRLSQSFELVSKNLESVQKGLGEMQQLASGVGDLKKVLGGVKSRGVLGEIQLGAILEQILAPELYQKNVATKPRGKEFVEYAVCLPGNDDTIKYCYLPIDSKFPVEDYHSLLSAYEVGEIDNIEIARKRVENTIKRCAKDIRDKYISPPHSTDFGIMFLPFEGLYAEVVRSTTLLESLHTEFKVVVTGPSTLAALLSSLRIGFRTLAIEKRSGEIRKTLQAVKTEFGKFGDVLKKAQDKINKASEDIDELVGTRTNKINSKLKSFENLPEMEAKLLLDSGEDIDYIDQGEEEN